MAIFSELQKRLAKTPRNPNTRLASDEILIADVRGRLSPGAVVEQKLRNALSINRRPANVSQA
jgi:hypothetical protein